MAVEGHENAGLLALAGLLHRNTNHLAVTKMHAIEGAHAKSRLLPLGAQRAEAEVDLHRAGSLLNRLQEREEGQTDHLRSARNQKLARLLPNPRIADHVEARHQPLRGGQP